MWRGAWGLPVVCAGRRPGRLDLMTTVVVRLGPAPGAVVVALTEGCASGTPCRRG
jgi:hypothetical protein